MTEERNAQIMLGRIWPSLLERGHGVPHHTMPMSGELAIAEIPSHSTVIGVYRELLITTELRYLAAEEQASVMMESASPLAIMPKND